MIHRRKDDLYWVWLYEQTNVLQVLRNVFDQQNYRTGSVPDITVKGEALAKWDWPNSEDDLYCIAEQLYAEKRGWA